MKSKHNLFTLQSSVNVFCQLAITQTAVTEHPAKRWYDDTVQLSTLIMEMCLSNQSTFHSRTFHWHLWLPGIPQGAGTNDKCVCAGWWCPCGFVHTWKNNPFFTITDDDADSDDYTHEINVLTLHGSTILHCVSEVDQSAVAHLPRFPCAAN